MADGKTNDNGQTFRIVQGKSELLNGYKLGINGPDYSRISVYGGNKHIHFGADSKIIIPKK
jgi:hypothetical protein